MLLGEEESPTITERSRNFCSQEAADAGVAIGLMPASNFIVAVILEAREGAELRVQRGRCISPFGEDSNGLVRGVAVIGAQVKQKRGVKCVPLRVQGIAGVFHEHQAVCIPERDVVEP